MKKILGVFAHPDDEAFGPGGTIAKYTAEGVEVHILCATRGEAGQWNGKIKNQISLPVQAGNIKNEDGTKIHHIREKELLKSAEILGVKSVEFMDYIDGRLCNAIYHEMAEKIIKKINDFKPQVVLTLDRLGISGHIDHMAVSMITTYAFQKTKIPNKLYYHCLPFKWRSKRMVNYFIYFPEGYDEEDITTRIDYHRFWVVKRKAMLAHRSQMKDVVGILAWWIGKPKIDHFILRHFRGVKPKFPETDFFAGIT